MNTELSRRDQFVIAILQAMITKSTSSNYHLAENCGNDFEVGYIIDGAIKLADITLKKLDK